MEKSLFLPYTGLRFTFIDHDHVFEVSFVNNGVIRYAATIGGKPFSITTSTFEERYKNGEIQCISAPEKLIINPETYPAIRRKERYIQHALFKLYNPTALEPLKQLIQDVSIELEDQNPPSPRTVARWIFQYRTHNNNILSLNNQYKANMFLRFPPEIYTIITQGIQEVYLIPEHRTARDVRAFVLGKLLEQGISTKYLPSQRTIQRYISKLDPYIEMKIKKGSRVARKSFQAAGASAPSPFAMYMVEIDTHFLDIIVIDPETGEPLGRPFLACAIDVYSRAIVGTYISMFPASSMTTLAVIKDMTTRPSHGLPGGVPSIIIPDNGIEFKNHALARVCEHLKITITPSQAYTPNDKAHIERFFGTITKGVLQHLPGTTFSNPTARGDYDSSKQAQLTLEQVKRYVDQWINTIYHKTIHNTTGRAPIIAWGNATQHVKPSFLTQIDADIICRRPISRTIHHGQVTIDYLSYYSHALTTLEANGIKKVTVLIDDLDLSKVYIINPDEKDSVIQADSTNIQYTRGLTHHVHSEVQKRKKLMTELDKQRLGQFADLYNLYNLMIDIQTDLTKKKTKLRQFKLQVSQKVKELEQLKLNCDTSPSLVIEDSTSLQTKSNKSITTAATTAFETFEVSRNEKI